MEKGLKYVLTIIAVLSITIIIISAIILCNDVQPTPRLFDKQRIILNQGVDGNRLAELFEYDATTNSIQSIGCLIINDIMIAGMKFLYEGETYECINIWYVSKYSAYYTHYYECYSPDAKLKLKQ